MLYCADVRLLRNPYVLIPALLLVALAAVQYGNEIWRGHPGDLYHRWLGSRELLLRGHNPYSEQVSEEIQIGLTGHKYDPRRDAVEQRFYYPIYVVFLMAPTVDLPFPAVRKIFAVFLLVVTAISVPLWLDFLQWRISPLYECALVVLVLCSMAALQGLYLQNLGLLVSALMAAACFALRRGRLLLAGPFLVFATIKPHLVVPLVVALAIWSTGAWRERRKLVGSFVLCIALLVVGGDMLLPGWLPQCLHAMLLYPHKSEGISPLQLVFGRPVGDFLAGATVLSMVYLAWLVRRMPAASPQFAAMVAWVLSATLMVVPSLVPYSDLQLLPAIFLVIQWRKQLWEKGRGMRLLYYATMALVIWPYLAILFLLPVHFIRFGTRLPLWELPLAVMPSLPLLAAATLGCALVGTLSVWPKLRHSAVAAT